MSYRLSRAFAAALVIAVVASVWGRDADVRSVLVGLAAGAVVAWAAVANEHDPAARP